MRRRTLYVIALSLLVCSMLGAATKHRKSKTHTVVMEAMVFRPPALTVSSGDTIVWVNKDIFRHTATARDNSFDLDLAPGAQAQTVVKKTGILDYYCRFHPGMTGKISVVRRLQ